MSDLIDASGADTAATRKAGSQSAYRSAYCEVVTGFHDIATFARHIGVASCTVYLWIKTFPEFEAAVKSMTRHDPRLRYREDYCEAVVEFLKDGYSLGAFAGSIGVTRATLYNWGKSYPEFAEAMQCARAKSALWWERRIIEAAQTGGGHVGAIIFGLKNRASEEWRDQTHAEVGGAVERIHRIERVMVRPERSEG